HAGLPVEVDVHRRQRDRRWQRYRLDVLVDLLDLLFLELVLGRRRARPCAEHLSAQRGGRDPGRRLLPLCLRIADANLFERLGGREADPRDVVPGRQAAAVVRLTAPGGPLDRRGSRFAFEALFLVALAVGLALADVRALVIVGVMALGWALESARR